MQSLSKKKSISKQYILVLSVILGLVLVGFFTNPFQNFLVHIFTPVTRGSVQLQYITEPIISSTTSKTKLLEEITKLKNENQNLSTRLTTLEQEKNTTSIWMDLFPTRAPRDFLLIPIISKPNQSPYDTFLLDAGSLEGVRSGAYLFLNQNTIIGTIDTVQDDTALGVLFSSPSKKTQARLERSSYDVTLLGRGGGNMIVEVPKEIETALGDRVLYPVFHNSVIGVIRDITVDERNANKKLFITLPTNILTLDHISVEK